MKNMKLDVASAFFSLAALFDHVKRTGPRLSYIGKFDPGLRCVGYGAGGWWWMRYMSTDIDVLVFIQLRIDNTARASVSMKTATTTQQWVLDLGRGEDALTIPEHLTFLEFMDRNQNTQLDVFSESLHDQTVLKFEASTGPRIVLDLRPKPKPKPKPKTKRKTTQNRKEESGAEEDIAREFGISDYENQPLSVSMRYKSEEWREYCVIVLAVTASSRDDRYCVVLKPNTILFRNVMLLYRRGFFGKMLNTIATEARAFAPASHLLNFQKLPHHCVAVCITQPSMGDSVDTSFRIGNVYDVSGYETNMAGDEFLLLNRDGEEVSRHSQHFIVFNQH